MRQVIKNWYFNSDRIEMLAFIPSFSKKILDIGCANGRFATLVKDKFGVEAWGIEINPEAARIASQHLDKVLHKDILDALNDLPEKYFDCIIFNDVLEHLIDPYTVLKKVKKNLSNEGVVIASLPNIRHAPVLYELLVKGNWDYQDYGVLDRTHLRFFTRKSIKKMFEEQGYTILKMDGINRSESIRGKLISKLLVGPFYDMKYIQFACLVKPNHN
ncbi:class I SAM-dependent methyltransferase [Synechococcus sp. PCC 6312]|uniref:class I SAM-dependent methyltransferase n=1 Tax=Synechococcus sp. (strain ATCC 27167 / PCC 6312) TaxID=195253 RepID=UPI00029F33D7|nr:class I SAM-dependent methyltransferase [Synechococcus sp. PCC 6312]AFY62542.1 methylase involved in ubiquinone/menaquinone biosynthesis [Synechococcus sp. PCC 6312]